MRAVSHPLKVGAAQRSCLGHSGCTAIVTNSSRLAWGAASRGVGEAFPAGVLLAGFSCVKELRVHARNVFRMPEKSSANACEKKKQIRKPSERSAAWMV